MHFSDIALSKRLERAEGHSCVQHCESHRRVFPACGAEWMECAGAYAIFDGIESPITQSFGIGVSEALTQDSLELLERFFLDHGAPVMHEVSPFAGVAALRLLCDRNYKPIETSNVLCRMVERPTTEEQGAIQVRVISTEEGQLWSDVSARGWSQELPELREFLQGLGSISVTRTDSVCFLAEHDGEPGAAALLCIHEGVALFGGSATVPELRRHGLQTALLKERMGYAFDHGCDLAMMVAPPGSGSQRNAERAGFRIAYTRTKWRLCT